MTYEYFAKSKNIYTMKDEGKTLTRSQVNTLLRIINDPTSFDDRLGLRCFQPDLKIIFYDQDNHPVSNIEISFECNQISTFPKLDHQSFSMDGYRKMKDSLSMF